MKIQIRNFWNSRYCPILLLTIVIIITLPLLTGSLGIGKPGRVGGLFLIINSLYAWYFGRWIQRNEQAKWTFLIVPGCFLMLVLLRYPLSIYAYLLVVLYFLIEYLAFILEKNK
ncbi:hypothetical protein HU830_01350 [Lactobacillus sp. DCY120]|uniref:Uncharacterized protein n=1 Tax=Bombilactobacillus apium TaxID=2675299 RepID=A0A850R5P0_9LACO|nr:hypothetical protein [Bombilactobacillus apium]NVY95855.1 hypothetical protein [Bombilactobacillus apium]